MSVCQIALSDILKKYYPNSARKSVYENSFLTSVRLEDILNDPTGVFEQVSETPGVSIITTEKLRAAVVQELTDLLSTETLSTSIEKIRATREKLAASANTAKVMVSFGSKDALGLRSRAVENFLRTIRDCNVAMFSLGVPDVLKTESVWRLVNGDEGIRNDLVKRRSELLSRAARSGVKITRYIDTNEILLLKARIGKYAGLNVREVSEQLDVLRKAIIGKCSLVQSKLVSFSDISAVPAVVAQGRCAYICVAGGYMKISNELMLADIENVCEQAEVRAIHFDALLN